MTHRTDTDRMEWLIERIQAAEEEILEICDDFRFRGQFEADKGANDALDALRNEFPYRLNEATRENIDAAMDAEERG